MNRNLYEEIYEYTALEAAYDAVYLLLDDPPDSAEEWLVNLQNHLIWRSYKPGEVPDMDAVVLEAISTLLNRYSIRAEDAGADIERIVDVLTLI